MEFRCYLKRQHDDIFREFIFAEKIYLPTERMQFYLSLKV